MKNLVFISCILIILFKTGNVLSDNNIFNVNNIEISKETSKNKEKLINEAFKKAFDRLIKRLLLEEDYKRLSTTNLIQVKKLISHYQIINQNQKEKNNSIINFNIFFDKRRVHSFFYIKDILYSDVINTEVILFPLLKKKGQYYIYTQNYFYDNWNNKRNDDLIQYTLPTENIENIQKITLNQNEIYKLDVSDFFKEYDIDNIVFANIVINKDNSKIFLNTRIEGKKINKTLSIKRERDSKEITFYEKIIFEIDNVVKDLIKSQNLIDVRTPSFLNVEIKVNNKTNLVDFDNRLKKIDLIDSFYVQKLNKDYIFVKIKYLGKINKIIKKLKDQNINLKMIAGQWKLSII